MDISLDNYLNQCNNKWKGKNIRDLPIKYLANIRLWIIAKCEEENLNYNDYDIYNNVVNELNNKENEKPILVYDKKNIVGHGKYYYVDKYDNYIFI